MQTILIHADGTIQVHPARGRTFRLKGKTFRLADQAYNEERLGPFVYTEVSTPTNVMVNNVIPFRPRQSDVERKLNEEVYGYVN